MLKQRERLQRLRISPYRSSMLFALGVFLLTFTISSFYAKSIQDQNQRDLDARLLQQASTIRTYMGSSMDGYSRLLLSTAAMFSIKPDITNEEWQGYYRDTQLNNRFPKLVGLGYVSAVPADDAEAFEQKMREEVHGDFTISNNQQEAGRIGVITHLALDTNENRRALGYNMFAEKDCNVAMERARDSARVSMTAPVRLV